MPLVSAGVWYDDLMHSGPIAPERFRRTRPHTSHEMTATVIADFFMDAAGLEPSDVTPLVGFLVTTARALARSRVRWRDANPTEIRLLEPDAAVGNAPWSTRSAVAPPPAVRPTAYRVPRGTLPFVPGCAAPQSSWPLLLVPAGLAAALAAGGSLTNGQAYYYVVTAYTVAGETTASAEVTATPATPSNTINLSWNAVPRAVGYRVYRGTTSGATNRRIADTTATSYSDGEES